MGCPISMFAPLISPNLARTAARNSSRLRSPSSKGASISDVFTPKACSSSSARPVFLATVRTSGNSSNICSASNPILFDSSNDMPGIVLTLTVSEPSLNGGRKLRPSPNISTSVSTNSAAALPSTARLCLNA